MKKAWRGKVRKACYRSVKKRSISVRTNSSFIMSVYGMIIALFGA